MAALGGPDHFVQHSPLVAAELRDGEIIRLGYKATNTNTTRKQFVVATDQRVFVLICKYFRRSEVKTVDSMDYVEIDTVGTVSSSGVTAGVVTSGNRSLRIPYHGGGAESVVAWIRLQIDNYDDVVDVRSLPRPSTSAIASIHHGSPAVEPASNAADERNELTSEEPMPQLGVADEIRKLGELLNEGLLTEEEFTLQKQRLLG